MEKQVDASTWNERSTLIHKKWRECFLNIYAKPKKTELLLFIRKVARTDSDEVRKKILLKYKRTCGFDWKFIYFFNESFKNSTFSFLGGFKDYPGYKESDIGIDHPYYEDLQGIKALINEYLELEALMNSCITLGITTSK